MPWTKSPVIYEINTWVWLDQLRRKHHRVVTLGDVPQREWDDLARWRFDAVWLMGVWQRSPVGKQIARTHAGLLAEYRRVLPDFRIDDVVGSPYCIRDYVVDANLGGPAGLAKARQELARRGMKLITDFVPNHTAHDHPLVAAAPDCYIQGTAAERQARPHAFRESNGRIIANGRDPYFDPWTDVAQLNAYHPGMRAWAIETLKKIAQQCDGVRCDMAMLMTAPVFRKTWGDKAGPAPAREYWREVIGAVRETAGRFLFMAEVYWDLEYTLQQQGFDLCYDKRLYDRLLHENAASARSHLSGDRDYQQRLMRFLENHDEPRAAVQFAPGRHQAAAVATFTLPGAKLLHDGQLQGRKTKVTVQLGRAPDEPGDNALRQFYQDLFLPLQDDIFREGHWELLAAEGWPDNQSCIHLLAWSWKKGDQRRVVAVNFSGRPAQGRLRLPWPELAGGVYEWKDLLSHRVFSSRKGDDMLRDGLYVDLPAWGYHLLQVTV